MYVGWVAGSVPSFKQSKLYLTLRGNCKGSCSPCSCSNYNLDCGALCIALHASRNVVQHLTRLETIQAIEHSAVVNACVQSDHSGSGKYPDCGHKDVETREI